MIRRCESFQIYKYISNLLEGHLAQMSDGCSQPECILFFLEAEAEGVKRDVSEFQFLGVINRVHLHFPLRELKKQVFR